MNKRMKKIACILALFLITTPLTNALQEFKKISFDEAINHALNTNPQIKMSKINVEISKNDIKVASKFLNPNFGTYQNIGKAGEDNPQQIGTDLTIEILKRGKRKELAKTNSLAIFDNQKFQEYALIYEVKYAYFNFLHKKANLKLITEQKKLTEELYHNAEKDYKNNLISKVDVIQAKIAYNRANIYHNIAKSELVKAQNQFNTILNSQNVEYDTKEETLSTNYDDFNTAAPNQLEELDITFDKVKKYALENRLDLLAAKQEVESAKNNLKLIKSQLIPDIQLIGGYGYQTKGMSSTGRYLSGAYAGVNLINIPLFYRYQPEIQNAKLQIEKAQLHYEDLKVDVTRDVTDAWEKFVIAKNNLVYYNDEVLANSKDLLNESIKSLNKKEIDMATFIISKKLYLELILSYQSALNDYYVSYAELLKEVNISGLSLLASEKI